MILGLRLAKWLVSLALGTRAPMAGQISLEAVGNPEMSRSGKNIINKKSLISVLETFTDSTS